MRSRAGVSRKATCSLCSRDDCLGLDLEEPAGIEKLRHDHVVFTATHVGERLAVGLGEPVERRPRRSR